MKLVPRWRRVLWRAAHMWPVYIAGALGIIPYIIPYVDDYLPRWVSVAILLLSPLGLVITKEETNADK